MSNTEARLPVETRNTIYTTTQKGEVNVNSAFTQHTEKNTSSVPASSSNLINLENNINLDNILKKEKTISIRVDTDSYIEYKKLEYSQKHFIQEALRALLKELLRRGVPKTPRDIKVDLSLNLNIDQKVLLTETCKDVLTKFEKYKKSVMCVQRLKNFRHIDHQMIDSCITGINPYSD